MKRVGPNNLGEDFGPMQPVQYFRYEGKGATVFDGDLVESPVVDHQTQFAIAFSKHDWSSGGGRGVANETVGQVICDVLLHLRQCWC